MNTSIATVSTWAPLGSRPQGSAPIQLNIIGNQWHLPDNGSQSRRWIQLASQAGSSYYLSDDNFDSRYRVTEGRDVWDELTAIDGDFASNFSEPQSKIYQAPTAHPLPLISDGNIPLPGSQVWDALKNEFGASGFRDAADRRIIAEIESSQAPDWALGPLDENEFGTTYSPLNSLSEIPTDSDNDGIPDSFEARLGTDPMTADNNGDLDRDGYTNLEEYLNLLAR